MLAAVRRTACVWAFVPGMRDISIFQGDRKVSVGNFQGTAAAAANGSAKPGVPSRLRRWLHAAALLLIVVFAVQAETAAAITPPTADACPASGDPPIAPGTVRTHPGHWHNPKRSGTGWD